MAQNILFPLCFRFGSYLSQILMEFARIWVILKAESCWAALILHRIGNRTRYTIQIKIQNGWYLLVRGDTPGDTSQPCTTLKSTFCCSVMLPPPMVARPHRWTSMMSAFLVAAAVVAAVTSAVEAAPEDASWLGKRLASSHPKNSRPKDLYSFGIGELS